MRRVALILATCLLAGCSVSGPQAPLHYAKHINTVTGDISTACGELTQMTAFPPPPPRAVRTIQADAASAVRELAAIDRGHPEWRFDGVDMRTIVNQARTMLRSCGLKSAAEQLKRESARS
jgi:outer membrane murein-binding lipoprotein Lpp